MHERYKYQFVASFKYKNKILVSLTLAIKTGKRGLEVENNNYFTFNIAKNGPVLKSNRQFDTFKKVKYSFYISEVSDDIR